MMGVEEFNQIEALEKYRLIWDRLLSETRGATFFQSFDWLEVFWKHYGAGRKLKVLLVFSSGNPSGILPLMVEAKSTRAGRLRCLTYPLAYWGSFYGPIGPDPGRTLKEGLNYLHRSRRDWDILELRYVCSSDTKQKQTEGCLKGQGFQAYKTIMKYTSLIDLQGTWEDYLASQTSKWRNNLKRWQRKLEEKGRVSHLRYRPGGEAQGEGDPHWDLYEACEEIARRSWQGSSEDGTTLSHDSISPFLREVHAAAAKKGALDLNLLLVADTPSAFVYNYHYQGYVYGLRIGYDPDVSMNGPGNVLYTLIIKDSFARGDHTYDLGPGSLKCKEYFKTGVEPITMYTHYHPFSPRAHLVRLNQWVKNRFESKK